MRDTSSTDIHKLEELIDLFSALAKDKSHVSVQDIVKGLGETAYLPLITAFALVVVSPLSGIFFLPTLMGLLISLLAFQMFFRKTHLWLPKFILKREISSTRLQRAAGWLKGLARWLDTNSRTRWQILVRQPVKTFLPLVVIAAALAMPFLELVPFSSSLLGMAITLICTGLLLSDGVWIVLASLFLGISALIPVMIYF